MPCLPLLSLLLVSLFTLGPVRDLLSVTSHMACSRLYQLAANGLSLPQTGILVAQVYSMLVLGCFIFSLKVWVCLVGWHGG